MDPRALLLTRGKPYIEAAGLIITEDGAWPISVVSPQGELEAQSNGLSTVVAGLSQTIELNASADGGASVASQIAAGNGTAGFEIPYLVGQGGTTVVPLLTIIGGNTTITANLSQVSANQVTINGTSTVTAPLTVIGTQQILVDPFAGTSTITAELFVDGIAELAANIDGSSIVRIIEFSLTTDPFDHRSIVHLYLFTNVGVGFDPTDIYTGPGNLDVQNFPDGHTRDDFWEYLYLYINVGAGFDPTDDASDRPDFVDQTFPDGHTAFDFHEYLYLYLNVVRGFQQQGQLVIRPGYTRGPILPGAHPPKNMPQ